MPTILVNPFAENIADAGEAAPRLTGLAGKTLIMLDISKPGGNIFLDRIEAIVREKFSVGNVIRFMKPTFTKPAPDELIRQIETTKCDAVIEALAD